MAVPKKKKSKSRTRLRQFQWKKKIKKQVLRAVSMASITENKKQIKNEVL